MCPEKGLDRLVDAYILLKRRERTKHLKLRVGGGCGPSEEPFVNALRERLKTNGVLHDVEFHPNLDRQAKLEFLRSLSVLCVPALYSEAFGLYVVEALASGVPVVQPRRNAAVSCRAIPGILAKPPPLATVRRTGWYSLAR